MRIFLILALSLIGAAAQAQDTTCNQLGSTINCTTRPSTADFWTAQLRAQQDDYNRQQAEVQAADRARAEARAAAAQARAAASERANDRNAEQTVASFVRAGQCVDARSYALDVGRMDLADQAARLCPVN